MECGGKRYPARRRFRVARGLESGADLRLSPHSKLNPNRFPADQLQQENAPLFFRLFFWIFCFYACVSVSLVDKPNLPLYNACMKAELQRCGLFTPSV